MELNITDMSKPLVSIRDKDGVMQVMRLNNFRVWSLCDVWNSAQWKVCDLETGDEVYVTPEEIRFPEYV